jgi:putative Holliday junction resolvase
MRIVALDLGERRIGVAAADDALRVAVPVATVPVEGGLLETALRIVGEQAAGEVIVGLPLSLTGALGPQAQRVMEVVAAMRERLGIPVHVWDERLSTVQAGRRSHAERGRRSRHPAPPTDAAAAAIILQAYLDSQRRP